MESATHGDSTARRIVDAATVEFATHGIAGARVDRIAREAKTSKERVYAYFRSKDELYRHVAEVQLEHVAAATQLDPSDLPAYAGRLHDYFVENPLARRLARWGALELSGSDAVSRGIAREKLAALKDAQARGLLESTWDPLDILVLINQLATAWVDQPVIYSTSKDDYAKFLHSRRSAIIEAVKRIFPPVDSKRPVASA